MGKLNIDIFEQTSQQSDQQSDQQTKDVLKMAIFFGDLDTVSRLYDGSETFFDDLLNDIIKQGHIDILKFSKNKCVWNYSHVFTAVNSGQLECLKFLIENGCPWCYDSCLNSAYRGDLEMLKFCHENGCPWHDYLIEDASDNEHWDCVQYAIMNGCTYIPEYYGNIQGELIPILNKKLCEYAGRITDLDYLKRFHEIGCPWNSDTILVSIFYGNLVCLKYAFENGCSTHIDISEISNVKIDYDLIDYGKCEWQEKCYECMDYAIEHFNWNQKVLNEVYDQILRLIFF